MRRRYQLTACIIIFLSMCILSSCGGSGGGDADSISPDPGVPAIDLSGTWAGIWSGKDPVEGDVYGHWQAEVTQDSGEVTGSLVLSGDVDCPDGLLAGSVDGNDLFSGTLLRSPCPQNEWELSAVNLTDRSAGGVWSQPGAGASGTFTGIQIATPGGPYLAYFNPPGGRAGAIVTIVGERFAPLPTDNLLKFNGSTASVSAVAGSSKLVTAVPSGASSGPVTLETDAGIAIGPTHFMTDVSSPTSFISNEISLGRMQDGIAVSPNGRRIYVAANHQDPLLGGLMLVDTASLEVLSETPVSSSEGVTLQGVAVSPDGRHVYVACDSFGVCVFDAINNTLITKIAVAAGQPLKQNPQGVALSPDGQLLYVADNRDGGTVSIVSTSSYQTVDNISLNAGFTPQGVAANPDGQMAYFTFSSPVGQNGQVVFYDVTQKAIDDSIEVGDGPIGIAVSPDGNTLYVSNQQESTVDVIDTRSHVILRTIQVSSGPVGVAISPDGEFVYVACRYSNLVNIIAVDSLQIISSLSVYPEPLLVAFTPDGKRAYVTHASFSVSEEIGGTLTLSVAKGGSGIGVVKSSPGTIDCGSSCQETFDSATTVTLTAIPDSRSYFAGWNGDQDCLDGVVFMDSNKYCVAVFNTTATVTTGTQVYGYAPGCFIATAAYGSYLDPHVQVLRDFRDQVLLKNRVGQMFVDLYYQYSPPLAAIISRHQGLRAAARIVLTPLVFSVAYPSASVAAILILLGLTGLRRMRKRTE
jgi:YVTN family beta-propeller protein